MGLAGCDLESCLDDGFLESDMQSSDILDQSMYNPLILHVEDRIARAKKYKRARVLKGLYLEIFAGFNKNSQTRAMYEALENSQGRYQFIGFFMEELNRAGLSHLAESLDRKNPGIVRVEVRVDVDDTLYRCITWKKRSRAKMLERVAGELSTTQEPAHRDELSYLGSLSREGSVSYLEIRVGSEIYGGKDKASFKKLERGSLFVREDLSHLPERYARLGRDSQMKILVAHGNEHNITAMIGQYLSDAGISQEEMTGKERRALEQSIAYFRQDDAFVDRVLEYHRTNGKKRARLPAELKELLPGNR